MFAALALVSSLALAPLSQAEQQELVDACVISQVCQPFVNTEGQIYARQLKYNASKAAEFFRGVDQAMIDAPIMPSASKCRDQLPRAFKGLELFKRLN